MRLASVRLSDLKRHASLDVELAPGLTVVRGPNEAGKSTIQRALEMGLFRRPTSTASDMDNVRPWSRPEAAPTIEIAFEEDGVKGRVVKVFAGARGTAHLELGGEVHTDPALVDQRLADLTGLPSEKFFRSTACIRHAELPDLDRDEGALRDRLHQSMSGADRGTWAARRKLQEAISRYRAEGAKNPGPVKQARDAIARLATDAASGEAALGALEHDRSGFAEARADREAIDARLAQAEADLEAAERAVAARDRLAKSEAEYTRYRRAAELREEIARAESAHPSPTALPVLRSGVEQLRSLEYEISEQRAELATQPDPSQWQATAVSSPAWQPALALPVLLAIGAVAALLAVGGTVGLGVAGLLGVFAVGSLLLVLRLRSRASRVRLQNEMRDTEIARRLRGRSDLEERLRIVERERDTQLTALGMADLSAAETLFAAETEHVASIERLRAEYRGLLGDAPEEWEDVCQLRDRMAATADEARHVLAGMGPVGIDPDGHRQRADAAVRSVRAEHGHAIVAEAAARARVEANTVDAEEVAATIEQLDATRASLVSHERRLRIYESALGALDSAEQATMKKAARFLEQRMGADVSAITDGRYRRVRVDENELRFSVYSAERGDWVDVTTLSQGTIDQIYLAARLGLVRQVTQDRRPPLVFDDPFVTFDDDRARRAVELLKRIAHDHQVIYLTCSDRYDDVADKVVALPGPEARDVPEESVDTPINGPWVVPPSLPAPGLPPGSPPGRLPRVPVAASSAPTAPGVKSAPTEAPTLWGAEPTTS